MRTRARVISSSALAILALVVGVAGTAAGHVTGGTILGFILAMTALWIVSPLVDPEDPADEIRRIALDEACRRADERRHRG